MLITSSFFNESIFSSSLFGHRNNTPYKILAQNLTEEAHLTLSLTKEQYEIKFDNRLDNYSRTLIFLYIPFFALAVMLIARSRYFYEHLIYSIHIVSFILLLFGLIITPLIFIHYIINILGVNLGIANTDIYVLPVSVISLLVYFYLSVRNVYGNSKIASLLKAIFLLLLFFVLFMFYRFILFLLVFYSFRVF